MLLYFIILLKNNQLNILIILNEYGRTSIIRILIIRMQNDLIIT